jgi:hypothetical protein
MGPGQYAGGIMIGTGITFGYLAGVHAAKQAGA